MGVDLPSQRCHSCAVLQPVLLDVGTGVRPCLGRLCPTAVKLHSARPRPTLHSQQSWSTNLALQASQAGRELDAARAEVQKIKQQQEAERARVKKAIAEMKRKIDG